VHGSWSRPKTEKQNTQKPTVALERESSQQLTTTIKNTMASLIWQAIFVFLAAELVVTLLLVVPIPTNVTARFTRSARIFSVDKLSGLVQRLKTPVLFVGIGLGMALANSIYAHQQILARLEEDKRGGRSSPHSYVDYFYPGMHDKERRYKSERNMYLSGFALTLVFVIGRIAALVRENLELHDETDGLVKTLREGSPGRRRKKN